MGRVLIVHFRVGRTDGVSLEIANWKAILESEGWEVAVCSGPESEGADYVIEDLEPQLNKKIFELDEAAFGESDSEDEDSFARRFGQIQSSLRAEFEKVVNKVKPVRVIAANVFSVGVNVAAAGALAEVLKTKGVLTVGVYHDFWWEDVRYRRPAKKLVEEQLEKYFPPVGEWMKHACINSIARVELARRKGVEAEILYDCLDFGKLNHDRDGKCGRVLAEAGVGLGDLVILQGTRIVRRKNIELAMDVVARLQKRVEEMGRKRAVLVMAGYAEKRDEVYQEQLRGYAGSLGIKVVELNGRTGDLLCLYPYADIVTYPSGYEGFGNQFLEAVYAKKPIIVYEYPVFKTDIKPLGFEVISLGDNLGFDLETGLAKVPSGVLDRVTDEVIEILRDEKKRKEVTEKNFAIGAANFSFERAGEVWRKLLI
ncbi:hypothetical protein A2899_04770 [Candidatus Amesbacteria bacterium RIFCSPLOWO2_01_FULL_49_25]|uniref:Glycosyl transferase family 1 domain-containing protein n=1 Tax=Candidatus Amesbacteria bacterium RIFCSPHIGHO2_01_FULL_48_32b TaxID=1797253 RepID=A0A1F4YDR7_9BACT|nr:MAG: hypothetical protein A2876_01750 [Candidatus Amesbacteria bacterium RIFCSPHIGHO2_01_FULL_48_32b]OGD07288.1 MAG: hypothetical protein A2899_04770 [Candidatus Amesbacteria bacterium RIFCSPLOWO2_01_FULL_49_25]